MAGEGGGLVKRVCEWMHVWMGLVALRKESCSSRMRIHIPRDQTLGLMSHAWSIASCRGAGRADERPPQAYTDCPPSGMKVHKLRTV